VVVRALTLLPRGVLGTLQHSRSLAKMSWEPLRCGASQQGSFRETPQGKQGVFPYEGDTLTLLGDFSHADICWKSSTASSRQSRRLLECIEDNLLSRVVDTPTRGDAILDLMVTSASELTGDIKIGGSLGSSDHASVEFTLLRDMGTVRSIVRTLNFRKANFQLFKELVRRTPWEMVLRDRGAEQSWYIFKILSIECKSSQSPGARSQARKGREPAWLI